MLRQIALLPLMFIASNPVFAAPKEDGLAAYHKVFESLLCPKASSQYGVNSSGWPKQCPRYRDNS